jgi:SAM-dependent methyltransferase
MAASISDLGQTDYAKRELLYNHFMQPALRSAIAVLAPAPGSVGLDVGCGPGGVFALLDEAAEHQARITGIDISAAHLAYAHEQIATHGLADRVEVMQADLRDPLPFDDATFDWVWTADTLSSAEQEQGFPSALAVVRDLVRVTRPGGRIACFFGNWLGAMFMPGHAHIEQCLVTAVEVRYNKRDRFHPSYRHENALAWFQQAGLRDIVVTPHVACYQQPLEDDIRFYIQRYLFETEYRNVPRLQEYALGAGLTGDEWETWLALSTPGDPAYLLARDDYFCVQYSVLTVGQVPAAPES